MQFKVNSDRLRVGGRILLSALIATASYACTEPGDPADSKSSDSKSSDSKGDESEDEESEQEGSKDKTPSKKKSEEESEKDTPKTKDPSEEKSEKSPEESEESDSTGSEEEESSTSTGGEDSSGGDDSSGGGDSTDDSSGDEGDCKVTAQWGSGKPFAAGTAIPNWKIETVFDQNGDGEIKGDELTPKKTDMAGVFCANPRNKFAVITFSSPT